jgi:hypothetical protein
MGVLCKEASEVQIKDAVELLVLLREVLSTHYNNIAEEISGRLQEVLGLLLNEISRFLEDRMRAIMQAMCNVLHTMDLFMAARITRLRNRAMTVRTCETQVLGVNTSPKVQTFPS